MTTIHLVRHAQASFGSPDYDRLSDKGIQQAHLVGEYFARLGDGITGAASGCLRRQINTARHALAALDTRVELVAMPAFDEYPIEALLNAYLPVAAARNARIAEAGADIHTDKRLYMAVLDEVAQLRVDGTEGADGPVAESWESFRARVHPGLAASLSGRDKEDAVVGRCHRDDCRRDTRAFTGKDVRPELANA